MWALKEDRFSKEAAERTFASLRKCLKRSAGLGAYPLLQFTEIWEFFGELYCDSPVTQNFKTQCCASLLTASARLKLVNDSSNSACNFWIKDRPREALAQLAKARLNLGKEEIWTTASERLSDRLRHTGNWN
jgi:hypothetical protein